MKPERISYPHFFLHDQPNRKLWVQAPLPDFLHTLPKLMSIEGQGSGRQGPSPLAPPGNTPADPTDPAQPQSL